VEEIEEKKTFQRSFVDGRKKNQPSVIKNFLLKNLKDNHSVVQIQLQEQRRNKKKKKSAPMFCLFER